MADRSSQATNSVWNQDAAAFPDGGPLREDTVADVCVVGAGIAGLSTAYLLAKAGKNVVVLEAAGVGDGETSRTTAHLASALDDRFTALERLHGERGARLAAESHAAAINRIEAIVAAEGLDCDFERLDGYLFLAHGHSPELLQREADAARRAGLAGVEEVTRAPLSNFITGPCLRFPQQGQFHPMRYLAGLATAFRKNGGRIFVRSPVDTFEGGPEARAVTRTGHAVRAGSLVVATNTPVNDRVAIHTKQAAYRTYAVALRIPAGSVPRALYWDTADPYHYVRVQPRGAGEDDLLIVGGEDHKTGQATDERGCFDRVETWTRERFPQTAAVVARWSGQIMEPVDGLAFIGRNPGDHPNVYIATGDSGHGMTHGTIAGILLTDLILGRDNPWAALYDPGRRTLWATGEYLRENANTAAQYLDWVTPGEVASADDIAPGEGHVIREGLTKVAVYRDEHGQVVRLSAVCPHLGGIVHWNTAEKTWDCPCHGSRFDARGRVVNGPALHGLRPVNGQPVTAEPVGVAITQEETP